MFSVVFLAFRWVLSTCPKAPCKTALRVSRRVHPPLTLRFPLLKVLKWLMDTGRAVSEPHAEYPKTRTNHTVSDSPDEFQALQAELSQKDGKRVAQQKFDECSCLLQGDRPGIHNLFVFSHRKDPGINFFSQIVGMSCSCRENILISRFILLVESLS